MTRRQITITAKEVKRCVAEVCKIRLFSDMEIKKIQGYTLIELIIVIGLLAGLSTVMVLNGSDARSLAHLENASRQLESALTEAQSYGNSGLAFPPGESDAEDFDKGYGVHVTPTDNKKIYVYGGLGDLDGDGFEADEEKLSDFNHYTAGGQVYEVIQLEGSVVIDQVRGLEPPVANSPNGGHVLFRRGQLIASAFTPNRDMNGLEITLKSGAFTKKVYVYSTGLIYIDNS